MPERNHFGVVYAIPGIEAFTNNLVLLDDYGAHHGPWADKPGPFQGEINGTSHVCFVFYG